jgi:signal transduction histidine kinase
MRERPKLAVRGPSAKLPVEGETPPISVYKEAFHSILKHSQAKRGLIHLWDEHDKAAYGIIHNGIGTTESAQRNRHNGIGIPMNSEGYGRTSHHCQQQEGLARVPDALLQVPAAKETRTRFSAS